MISADSGLWVDLLICFLIWLVVMGWFVWHKWLSQYQSFPLDHYLGKHTYCTPVLCTYRKTELRKKRS